MKIVITGALGHIGSRLMRELPLLVPDLEMVLIDNLSTQRFSSLFDLPSPSRCRFIEGDVTAMELEPVIDGADAVIHLAAITDAAGSFGRKDEVEQVNFTATRRLAEAAATTGAALLFPSSTSVYGSQSEIVDEDCSDDELQPQSPYAETKLREEALLAELGEKRGLRFATCRFGTIFGTSPGMRFHTAVNKFCWQAVMGQKLTVWRTAYDQKRPYLDLGDAVSAVAFFLEGDGFDGRVYNVVTVNATVRQVVEVIGSFVPDLEVGFVDERIMNQLSYEVLNTRLGEAGFAPAGDLEKGVGETIALLRRANAA
jgi:nucleoside-diphosphate-sugar epimerase